MRVDLFLLPLSGLDVVLGVQWLSELGRVVSDYKKMTMEFRWRDSWVKLSATTKEDLKAVTSNSIKKIWKSGGQCFSIQEVSTVNSDHAHAVATWPTEIEALLQEFISIIEESKSIPPQLFFDHKIPLLEEDKPVNVPPYRYAHFQKDEIEKQVHEMLQNGLIRPSNGPFSSPVLLVRKKDGSWRFCNDYRALNEATIKDRFPIPTVDDMLDELQGTQFFSKLDLRAGYHQVRVHETDIHKTAFQTHNGHYEYLVMPFGLCNAPSTF